MYFTNWIFNLDQVLILYTCDAENKFSHTNKTVLIEVLKKKIFIFNPLIPHILELWQLDENFTMSHLNRTTNKYKQPLLVPNSFEKVPTKIQTCKLFTLFGSFGATRSST